VLSADIQVFREYASNARIIRIDPNQVSVDSSVYSYVLMKMFLVSLSTMFLQHLSSYACKDFHHEIHEEKTKELFSETDALTLASVTSSIQRHLTPHTELFVDMGYSNVVGKQLKLPAGCGYNSQRLYPCPGWTIGASLGAALALASDASDIEEDSHRELFVVIDDKALQMSVQEISTMIRQNIKLTLLVLVNCKFSSDITHPAGVDMHLNESWDYLEILSCFDTEIPSIKASSKDRCLGIRAKTVGDLDVCAN